MCTVCCRNDGQDSVGSGDGSYVSCSTAADEANGTSRTLLRPIQREIDEFYCSRLARLQRAKCAQVTALVANPKAKVSHVPNRHGQRARTGLVPKSVENGPVQAEKRPFHCTLLRNIAPILRPFQVYQVLDLAMYKSDFDER